MGDGENGEIDEGGVEDVKTCPRCTGKPRPIGHDGGHTVSEEEQKARDRARSARVVAEGKQLTCDHPLYYLVLPGGGARWGRCLRCGSVATVRIAGKTQGASGADRGRAMSLDLEAERKEHGFGADGTPPAEYGTRALDPAVIRLQEEAIRASVGPRAPPEREPGAKPGKTGLPEMSPVRPSRRVVVKAVVTGDFELVEEVPLFDDLGETVREASEARRRLERTAREMRRALLEWEL